jgi:NADH-quinone oxidoreductase subunit C
MRRVLTQGLVPAAEWRQSVEAARDEGYRYFDWLGVVDEIGRRDTLRIVVALRNLARAAQVLLITTEAARDVPRLESIREVFAGAAWHEREAAELFGVEFPGGERARLLLNPEFEGTPLRKDEVLPARTGTSWPGGKEPGESDPAGEVRGGGASPGRRRMVPPGVPDPAVWGDRGPGDGDPDPAEVADAVTGGRVRRRRS